MIEIIRSNGEAQLISCLYVRAVESIPQTLITLAGGERLIVQNTLADIQAQMTAQFRQLGMLCATERISALTEETA